MPAAGSTSLVVREPAITQGIVTAIIAAVGLFGVQGTEGLGETAISIAVTAVPLLGAPSVRGRVQPMPRSATPTDR
ncbi:hypothetical protein SAMN05661080_01328 [Modestobacter sp. DSM 44400]|uniref:hypothetical protein n=1 Tax=Modestobacter sp. DSM 44400 TaxID=1550230 RepID=UPI0008973F2B|nr:hypothetical protein [Modestobacter sp. DSM 44400]SDX82337.1 hypothetical protein SAMN05661080_01328 [Modestobacter sp. DSM 44400]